MTIKEMREQKGLSAEEVAELSYCDVDVYISFENAESKPEYDVYRRILEALEIDTKEYYVNFDNGQAIILDKGKKREKILGFGQKLSEVRKEKGFTQKQLGDVIGCTRSFIWNVEKSVRCTLSQSQLIAIADFMGVDPLELLGK